MRISTMGHMAILCAVLMLGACSSRQYANINAVVDPDYSASGQSYDLVMAPAMPPEAGQDMPMIKNALAPALARLGYSPAAPGQTPDVRIEAAYGISGPEYIYTPTSYAWGNSTPGQFFYIPPTSSNTIGWPRAYDEDVIYTRAFTLQAFKNKGEKLHSPLWAVNVESKGTTRALRVLLPGLINASLPWLGQSGQSSTVLATDGDR